MVVWHRWRAVDRAGDGTEPDQRDGAGEGPAGERVRQVAESSPRVVGVVALVLSSLASGTVYARGLVP